MTFEITLNVFPLSCDNNPFTFSPKKTFGETSFIALANSKNNVPLAS